MKVTYFKQLFFLIAISCLFIRCSKNNAETKDQSSLIDNQKITIDGLASYTGKNIQCGINYDPSLGIFILSVGSPNSNFPAIRIVFYLTKAMKPGDIVSLKAIASHLDLHGWARYMEALGYENDFSTENSSYSGTLTITQFDSKNRILSGTFQFSAVATDQYGKYLGERTVSGTLENLYCIDATDGHWQ